MSGVARFLSSLTAIYEFILANKCLYDLFQT